MLEKITLIIPTKNRHKYLERILDYYSGQGVNICVCDSSKSSFAKKDYFKNVRYFHYPNFRYSEKLHEVFKKISTKYAVMCADDDFIVPSSIEKCVRFLEKNKDYSSVQGHHIFFTNSRNKSGNISYAPIYLHSLKMDLNSNFPSQRVKELMSSYMQLLYSICRTNFVREVFSLLRSKKNINNFNLVELFHSIFLCISGKCKVLPIFYCAREEMDVSANIVTDPLEVIARGKKYKEEYNLWKKLISESIVRKEHIEEKKATRVVSEAINLYCRNTSLIGKLLNIKTAKNFANIITFGLLKKIYLFFLLRSNNKKGWAHAVFKEGTKKEIEKIKRYVLKFNV